MKYSTIKTEDDNWAVIDELGTVIDVRDSRIKAREMVRELSKPPVYTHLFEGTYGTGVEVEKIMATFVPLQQPVIEEVVISLVDETGKAYKKADVVRTRIGFAKRNNEDPTVVIQWAVDNLGMTKALAKSYVQNNWSKV